MTAEWRRSDDTVRVTAQVTVNAGGPSRKGRWDAHVIGAPRRRAADRATPRRTAPLPAGPATPLGGPYPFNPLEMNPWTMYRCANTNSRIIGRTIRVEMAMM